MAAPLPPGLSVAAFEVSYVSGDAGEHRVPLAEALAVPFEQGLPVRRFASQQGQWHLSGLCPGTHRHPPPPTPPTAKWLRPGGKPGIRKRRRHRHPN